MTLKQLLCWFFLMISMIMWMNVMVLREHDFLTPMERYSDRLRQEFGMFPSLSGNETSLLNETKAWIYPRRTGSYLGYMERGTGAAGGNHSSSSSLYSNYQRSRTLVGIISADTRNDCTYRRRHRELFQIWNDTRVCSLAQLKAKSQQDQQRCQLVYTFVIGAASTSSSNDDTADPNMNKNFTTTTTTLIVDSSIPLYRSSPLSSKFSDVNEDDVTLLNIKYVSVKNVPFMDGW